MGNIKYFILLLLLSSCGLSYCHKVQLTDDDLSWINHYHANDKFKDFSKKLREMLFNTPKIYKR
jgi:hypothetical protein